jgi:hypothetical protein
MKCGGLTPNQLVQQSASPSNLSLLGLVRHLSGVEAWFHAYDGRPDHQFFWNYLPGASDGFSGVSADRAYDDLARYLASVERSRRAVKDRADDDLASYLASVERSRRAVKDRALDEVAPGEHDTLRWIYLHMIEEYARHNGHADVLRERIDAAIGE